MAVQAAQHPSNAFYSEYPSRMPIGSVLEGLQTMQSRQLQIDHLPIVGKVAAGLPNASVFSDHPQSELTCNVSGSRKRSHDEMLTLSALPQLVRVSNPSLLAASFGLKNGSGGAVTSALLASREQSMRVFDSAAASTSGRPSGVSSQSASAPGSFGREVLALIRHHNFEMDELIRLQNEKIRLGLEEARKRHCKSLLSILEQVVVKRLREKETELEGANRKNAELEEKIQQMSAENQIWFNVAKNNEILVSNLRTNLEQVLFQNAATAAAVPSLKEGYGDSDGAPLLAEDVQSFCYDNETHLKAAAQPIPMSLPANDISRQQMNCKVCGVDEVSVLVLPCRHLCLCQNCESSVALCPICNYPKNACLQVFMS
ncbi:hypothetical protein IEQ34_004301 [Dendrobium chrysotoxum]|uniref:RING-type domain-containing protein n=1 Tax=Dendrobium chrysotoxum TaxID=161865 RepID=A0AAV7HHS6_DENCH|nr:hypothetical protein IEQ34_004301 [Dendrobium chrysotoxum]